MECGLQVLLITCLQVLWWQTLFSNPLFFQTNHSQIHQQEIKQLIMIFISKTVHRPTWVTNVRIAWLTPFFFFGRNMFSTRLKKFYLVDFGQIPLFWWWKRSFFFSNSHFLLVFCSCQLIAIVIPCSHLDSKGLFIYL